MEVIAESVCMANFEEVTEGHLKCLFGETLPPLTVFKQLKRAEARSHFTLCS